MKHGYIDSSVIARIILDEPQKIANLEKFSNLACSELVFVELRRTLDRCRLTTKISDFSLIEAGEKIDTIKRAVTQLNITSAVLTRAGQPLPIALGTLDAIHLASALLWQELIGEEVSILTHDLQLAKASRLMGLNVFGC